MNIYGIIILCTLIFNFILDFVSEHLNIRNMGTTLPKEFVGVYDEETYKKSQLYTKTQTKFGYITSTFGMIVMLLFWYLGGFNYVDIIVSGWFTNMILRGIFYIGVLSFANFIISLPFSIYSTFVIEEKFGFNKTTPKTFVLDILKSFGLSIVLGVPVLAGVLYIFSEAGVIAWLYGWAAVTLFSLIIQYVAPRWIMPLFNKFTPLEEGELKTSIMNYLQSVSYSVKNIFVMDGSKRSSKSNAFFTGFGKNKRIALFDTLIEKHTIGELVSILAHEIGHFKKKHILVGMIISTIHSGILFYLLSIFLTHKGLYDAFYVEHQSIYTGLIFFGMLYTPIETILSIFMSIYSRKNEYQADNYAVTTRNNKDDMVNALKKLSKDNLSNLEPHPFYVFLNYSHPPVLERIHAIDKILLKPIEAANEN